MKRKLDILSFLQANSDRITIRGRSVSAALLQDKDLLSADSVDLTDCGLTEVPSELAQLSKLRRLTLSRNRIRTFSSISNLNERRLYQTRVKVFETERQ